MLRIDEREIGVDDAFPAALDGGCWVWGGGVGGVEDGGPFLGYEGWRACEGGVGEEGEHVDSVDVFSVGAEVGCCVDFVLEELGGRDGCQWISHVLGGITGGGGQRRMRRKDERKEDLRLQSLCYL